MDQLPACNSKTKPNRHAYISSFADNSLFLQANHIVNRIQNECKNSESNGKAISKPLDNMYLNCSPTQCWYYLKLTYSLLVPANNFQTDETKAFQVI